jgi:hypothetical protein
MVIAHDVACTFDGYRLLVGPDMNRMHNSAELLGNHNCVIQHSKGFRREIDRHHDCLDLDRGF